jgi:hypothetical protein
MCISKLFFPSLLLQPWFFNILQRIFLHFFLSRNIQESELFHKGLLIPVVYNDEFYFALDIYKITRIRYFDFETLHISHIFCRSLNLIRFLFYPYKNYKPFPYSDLYLYNRCLCNLYIKNYKKSTMFKCPLQAVNMICPFQCLFSINPCGFICDLCAFRLKK